MQSSQLLEFCVPEEQRIDPRPPLFLHQTRQMLSYLRGVEVRKPFCFAPQEGMLVASEAAAKRRKSVTVRYLGNQTPDVQLVAGLFTFSHIHWVHAKLCSAVVCAVKLWTVCSVLCACAQGMWCLEHGKVWKTLQLLIHAVKKHSLSDLFSSNVCVTAKVT
jgi:hypothetical protein